MKRFIITVFCLGLLGCSSINQKELNNLADTSFEAGFSAGMNCMDKLHNVSDCFNILQRAKEKLNDSKN